MRDLDSLLNSLVNIDRHSLVAILASEAEAAQRSVNSARERTASQRAKRREAVEHLVRVDRILSFFQQGDRWPLKSRRRFDPVDVLHYAIEEFGHSQAELADILGSRSRASEVLARRRPLILEMIQKITASWKIPGDLLARPYRVAATAA